jgi:hypothetical protein
VARRAACVKTRNGTAVLFDISIRSLAQTQRMIVYITAYIHNVKIAERVSTQQSTTAIRMEIERRKKVN